MASRVFMEREGVRLAGLEFGGAGPSVLLLHGLAGYAGEWGETASSLTERWRVLALDARGHGESEREPADVSVAARVADVVFAVEELALAPVVLVGQSLGGITAMLVAAERPDLVRGLVLADTSPAADDDAAVERVAGWLRGWPVPFPSREAAIEFFGAEAWADGLERREDGLRPRFEVDVLERTLRETAGRSFWREWESIACPTLVVRAGKGMVPSPEARAMADRLPGAELVEIPGAGHDLHLDSPAEWRAAVTAFLVSLPSGTPAAPA